MNRWPAAKYLSYAFWRSFVLVCYTAPIWGYLAAGAEGCSNTMYVFSTIAFAIMAIVYAVFHQQAGKLLFSRAVILGAGILASAGLCMEFGAVALYGAASNVLFVAGALLTGVGTATIAMRAGQVYATARPVTSFTNAVVAELASGLVFFFIIGTLHEIALVIAALLPLAAALMLLFDADVDAERERAAVCPAKHDAGMGAQARRASFSAFLRFLVIVFLLTFVANLMRSKYAQLGAGQDAMGDALGISLSIIVCFCLLLVCAVARSFNFGIAYYPLVLLLAFGLIVAFVSDEASEGAQAIAVLVYSLFSLFTWYLLCYLARGDYFNPLQVLGWGRCVFAIGSLAGMLVGTGTDYGGLGEQETLVLGVALAFALVAAAMLIFNDRDVEKITRASWLAAEAGQQGTQPGAERYGHATRDAAAADAAEAIFDEGGAQPVSAESYAADHNLTAREREVFMLMLRGRDARAIGEALVISDNTAKAHIRSIYAKTGVHSRREFVEATDHIPR